MKSLVISILGILLVASVHAQSLPNDSVYNMKSEFLDVNAKPVKLSDLKGRPVVISMGYTGCSYACPLILSRMQDLQKEIQKSGLNIQPHFVLISFDYENDTPKVLKSYAEIRKLSNNWLLFASSSDHSPREIANLLGIQYRKMKSGYDHSFVIAVLDSQGVLRGRINGADKDPKELIKYLVK